MFQKFVDGGFYELKTKYGGYLNRGSVARYRNLFSCKYVPCNKGRLHRTVNRPLKGEKPISLVSRKEAVFKTIQLPDDIMGNSKTIMRS